MSALLNQQRVVPKDPDTSAVMIRQDAPGTFRVLCTDCLDQFDLFGEFKAADAVGESATVQRILEHLAKCSERKGDVLETVVYSNVRDPLWKLTVRWTK